MITTPDWEDRIDELTPSQRELVKHLGMERRVRMQAFESTGFAYAGMPDFLLQHGTWFNTTVLPNWCSRGAERLCFFNASVRADMHRLRYVEGVGWLSKLPFMTFHHAWNALPGSNQAIDATWPDAGNPKVEIAYLGVEFGRHEIRNALLKGYTMLDGIRRFSIYRKPYKPSNQKFSTKQP
jgi:hypothetical protein